ncbi:MAG: hypothetical protein Q8M24_15660 [Pseudolabrys sp.]|nr:hypothetical protein [Pseudolabrys sp.]MDP2296879.1 hypothetical protein [Pseudolabrys sp.]
MLDGQTAPRSAPLGLKLAALALAVAIVGLPVNNAADYALLAVATIVIFSGAVRMQARAWLAAAAIAVVAIGGQILLAPPRIDEGHNVFLPGGPHGALERGLPADVYRHLAQEFDKEYPPAKRCLVAAGGCWAGGGFPDRAFAFSADGIFHTSDMSRSVTELDFSDPVWLRLGFINDMLYNWSAASDVQRASRDRRFYMGVHRWHLTMPWFEMIRLPAAYAGGQLCWRGDVMWEGAGERFSLWRGDGCRAIEPADAGRRVVGVAIKPDSLAMRLEPPTPVRLKQLAQDLIVLAAVAGFILVLVRIRPRQLILPSVLVVLSVLVIAIDDASFLGGVRPFDGGDDGLFYDGVARQMLQQLLAGDVWGFLRGGEDVFYYGGPGLRYLRALEHIVFGESYLGYLTLVLLLPFFVLALGRRFLPGRWALALAIMFVAVPLGELFGTTFIHYSKWASRGYADPAAYIFFIAGLIPLLDARGKFWPAFFGALLLALGIAMKPIVAPAAAVFLGGAGLYALYLRQWPRLAGLCLGFLPVFSMALHNWIFGKVLVLFSSNAAHPLVLVMPSSAYAAALRELATFDFSGGNLVRAIAQVPAWLSGPAESYWTVPLNAAGVVILVYVVLRGRRFDPWLRLVGAAALAQHAVALFYVATARYHFLTWFLTMLVVMVFLVEIGFGWLRRRYPVVSERLLLHPLSRRIANGLSRLQKVSA